MYIQVKEGAGMKSSVKMTSIRLDTNLADYAARVSARKTGARQFILH